MAVRQPSMKELRLKVKAVSVGTGEVARAICECGFTLSERGITTLIVSCARNHQWERAVEVFQAMSCPALAARVKPNFYIYSALISVCCAGGAFQQALDKLGEMRATAKLDPKLKPDVQLYRILMGSFHAAGRHADVLQLFDMLLEDSVEGYSSQVLLWVLEDAAKGEDWEKAFLVLDKLNELKMDVPQRVYTKLLATCAKRREFEIAIELFLGMQMAGIVPDSFSCHNMIAAAASAEPDGRLCVELLQSMHETKIPVLPCTYEYVFDSRGGGFRGNTLEPLEPQHQDYLQGALKGARGSLCDRKNAQSEYPTNKGWYPACGRIVPC